MTTPTEAVIAAAREALENLARIDPKDKWARDSADTLRAALAAYDAAAAIQHDYEEGPDDWREDGA